MTWIADLVLSGRAGEAAAILASTPELRDEVLQRLESRLEEAAEPSGVFAQLADLSRGFEADGRIREQLMLGELLYHLDQLDRAIELAQVVPRHDRFAVRAFNLVGLCFARKRGFNMLKLAARQFQKGIERCERAEDSLELRYNLASLWQAEGRWRQAFDELTDLLAIDPHYRDARARWTEVRKRL